MRFAAEAVVSGCGLVACLPVRFHAFTLGRTKRRNCILDVMARYRRKLLLRAEAHGGTCSAPPLNMLSAPQVMLKPASLTELKQLRLFVMQQQRLAGPAC